MKERVRELYLDYANNFLTVDVFAAYYGLDTFSALRVIQLGRKINKRYRSRE